MWTNSSVRGERATQQADQPDSLRSRVVRMAVAADLNGLRSPPANRLKRLFGDRQGQHSVRINDQWHIRFSWRDGDAYDVEICDYH
ncbi:MAG: type II toxin-antitoxin system RelE/ParE family toxin [Actinobacteria bacterium]|nr:type II toxin-antitoxin system RelE/ParE family toxin [Actinomycetota bacterium]